MPRKIDLDKAKSRIRKALQNLEEHVARVHFGEKNLVNYRVGPGDSFIKFKFDKLNRVYQVK